jgi:hypothetical protein
MIWCYKSRHANEECVMPVFIDMFIRISHLLVCVNSSANFIIYYLNGEKFREPFLVVDCTGKVDNKQWDVSLSS